MKTNNNTYTDDRFDIDKIMSDDAADITNGIDELDELEQDIMMSDDDDQFYGKDDNIYSC